MAMPDIEGFVVHEQLGSGASGIVYRASPAPVVSPDGNSNEESTQEECAVKVYDPERGEEPFRKECEFLEAVNGHPNVAGLVASFEGERNVLVMPLYSGPALDTLVRRVGSLSEERAKGIFQDVLAATQHVHGRGILHRDIKPDNILIAGDGQAVLVDFDVSCYTSETRDPRFPRAGTPGYVAPEVIMRRPYGKSSDLFSIGCTLYFMFKKRPPFYTKPYSKEAVYRKTIHCKCHFDVCFDDVGEACKRMISALVRRTPAKRLTSEQALQHTWFTARDSSDATSNANAEAASDEGPHTSSFAASNGSQEGFESFADSHRPQAGFESFADSHRAQAGCESFADSHRSQAGCESFADASDSMADQSSFASVGQREDQDSTSQRPTTQIADGAAHGTHGLQPKRPSWNRARQMFSFRAARLKLR